MVEILAFVAIYRILTVRLVLRTADLGLLHRQLLPQIEAIKQACGTDIFKASQQTNELYKKHGGSPGIGCLWGLLDLVYFLVFLAIASARSTSPGGGLLWVSNLKAFSSIAPFLWIGARYVQELVHRKMVMGAAMGGNIATGAALIGGLIYFIAWYWQWPAYVFLFGMVLHGFNAVILVLYVLTGGAGQVAGTPTPAAQASPAPPSPRTPPSPATAAPPQPQQSPFQPAPPPQPQPTPPFQPAPQPRPAPQPQPAPQVQAAPPSPPAAAAPAPIPKPLDLAAEIGKVNPGGTLTIDPPDQHVQGPVVIRKPITIDGQNGTIWAPRGPVVSIESDAVVLQHLSVEVTGPEADLSGPAASALVLNKSSNVSFNDVAVRGYVQGFPAEEGTWRYPRSIALGAVKAGQRHAFKLRLVVGVPCQLVSHIAGLSLEPGRISGAKEITLKLDALSPGTRLRGSVLLKTSLLSRTIVVTGNVPSDGSGTDAAGRVVYEPSDWETVRQAPPPPPKVSKPPAAQAASPSTETPRPAHAASPREKPPLPAAPKPAPGAPSAAPPPTPETAPLPAQTASATGRSESKTDVKSPASRTLKDSVFGGPPEAPEGSPQEGSAGETPETQPSDASEETEKSGASKRRKVIRGGGLGVFGDDLDKQP